MGAGKAPSNAASAYPSRSSVDNLEAAGHDRQLMAQLPPLETAGDVAEHPSDSKTCTDSGTERHGRQANRCCECWCVQDKNGCDTTNDPCRREMKPGAKPPLFVEQ